MTTDSITKLLVSFILLFFNSFIVMAIWNLTLAPELGLPELSYLASVALVFMIRFCMPPRFED